MRNVRRGRGAALVALAVGSLTGSLAVAQAAGEAPKAEAKPKVAVFRLAGNVTESPREELAFFGNGPGATLRDLVARMTKAAGDPDVKAVVLLDDGATIGRGQAEELRQAIRRVRDEGKEVYAHADGLGMGAFVLLSAAGRLSVVPTGTLEVTGLYVESPYLRGLLDRLGVRPDFQACGAYKSAAEIFMRDGPSPQAQEMEDWLLDSVFGTQVRLIAEARGVDETRVRAWIDAGPYTAEQAKQAGLIDAVETKQDLEALLKRKHGADLVFDAKYGKKAEPKPDFSSPFGLLKFWGELLGGAKPAAVKKPAVAVVAVEGPIVLGRRSESLFEEASASSTAVRRALDQAARDEAVKAVVLRVNSPGGSATASEIILDATRRVKANKPFAVSMGDVAGSGGYYVACASDLIFADRATITASIGVVGGKLGTRELFDRLGIRFHAYKRGKFAGMLASDDVFTPEERAKFRSYMDEVYEVFRGHVRTARGDRLKKPLDELAGGRVYTGQQALELGLIDCIGTLDDAIRYVAEQAKLKDGDYDVRDLPRPRSFLEQLVEESEGEPDNPRGLDVAAGAPAPPGPALPLLDLAASSLRAPDPARARAVRSALQQLELLRREGVGLTMPDWRLGP